MSSVKAQENNWTVVDSISLSGAQYLSHIAIQNEKAYVSRYPNLVTILDLNMKSEIANITFAPYTNCWTGYIAFYGDSAYATLYNLGSNGKLAVINTITNSVQSYVSVGPDPYGVATHNGRVYVTNYVDWADGDSSTVKVIDINTLQVIDTIEVGKLPYGIVIDSVTNKAYVSNQHSESNSVSVFNTITGDSIKTIPMYNQPRGMTITNGKVYVTNSVNPTSSPVKVIDINNDNVIQTIMVGRDAIGIASYGRNVFVANQSSYSISVIDTASNTVIATVPLGNAPYGIAVNSQTGKVYAAMQTNRQIKEIENTTVGISEKTNKLPNAFVLFENFPNPFNPTTVIGYQLTESSKVVLKIYNTLGQEIRLLVDEMKSKGNHTSVWDGKDNKGNMVSSGVYLYQLQAGQSWLTKK